MITLCFDSPLTPALSPPRGEGDGAFWASLSNAWICEGSGFGGGRLRTASPTILMRREAADEVWMGGGEGLGLGRGAPRPYREMGSRRDACGTASQRLALRGRLDRRWRLSHYGGARAPMMDKRTKDDYERRDKGVYEHE